MNGGLARARLRALGWTLTGATAALGAGAALGGPPRWMAWASAAAVVAGAARAVWRSPEPGLVARWPRVAAAGVWGAVADADDPALAAVWTQAEGVLEAVATARRYRAWVRPLGPGLETLLERAEAVARHRRALLSAASAPPPGDAGAEELAAIAGALLGLRRQLLDLEHAPAGTDGPALLARLNDRVAALREAVGEGDA